VDRFEVSGRRLQLRRWVTDSLGGECSICGYSKCLRALEAHHIDPRTKDFSISDVASVNRIEHELEKCVLLCANCHREVHDGLHPGYLVLDGDFSEVDFGGLENDLSYTEEMELEAVLEQAEQAFWP
jgi:5-methylcytosine-specific restriction endonuclease McrA